MRLAAVTTLIVVLLSWINEIRLLNIIIRAAVSFGVMYFLMIGSLNLFEKTAPQNHQDIQSDSASGKGGNIDFSVGEEELLSPQGTKAGFPGQIDPVLTSGLPDSEKQAEIVRRMGWQ